MMTLNLAVVLGTRIVLCALFLPFSALDKVLNFTGAVAQAGELVPSRTVATGFILAGLSVEVFMSLGVITGVADRACALVLAGYCAVTALGWKQFWKPGDFWTASAGRGRTLFWDFLKNFALGAGFLLIAFGTQLGGLQEFVQHPLASSHPYQLHTGSASP
jgi:putative oxidoreductase